jgi:hypothetical protein
MGGIHVISWMRSSRIMRNRRIESRKRLTERELECGQT